MALMHAAPGMPGGMTMKDIGLMIIEDHREFRREILELRHSPDTDAGMREEVLADLLRRLAAHHVAEEMTLFPAMEELPAEKEFALELIEEHRAMEILYSDLVMTGYGKEIWVPRMRPILEVHETHMAREESNLIPRLHKMFGNKRLEELGESFDRYRQAELKKEKYAWRDCNTAAAERLR
jgi:hemerythrin superfamily protein